MLTSIKTEADIRGSRINLAFVWTETQAARTALRLVRRRRAYPIHSQDGLVVMDLAALFEQASAPWARIERVRYVTTNAVAEAGLALAEVALYYSSITSQLAEASIVTHNATTDLFERDRWTELTRIATLPTGVPWQTADSLDIFAAPGGGPEQLVARVNLSANQFEWQTAGLTVGFDEAIEETTAATVTLSMPQAFAAQFQVNSAGAAQRTLRLNESFNLDTGEWLRNFTFRDENLAAETIYYYALFAPDLLLPGVYTTDVTWRAGAMATGAYGLADRLYQLLPSVHRRYDEPVPGQPGQGQLRRFLDIFGAAQDQVRSLAEGLRGRHDVLHANGELLPLLARWIGWEPDQTLDELSQRNDILFAPEVYQTVGTLPNIRALVNRVTGWECQVKEFVHNVFLTNSSESPTLSEIWVRVNGGVTWGAAAPVTRTERYDGRPAAVLDSANTLWLFWHSDRGGRRELWFQRQDGVDPQPQQVMAGAPDDAARLTYSDEDPAVVADGAAVRLFWSSNRAGSWEIWSRLVNGGPGLPERLSDHPAADRHPAAVRLGTDLWLFWQSNRRGPTDIWAQVFDGVSWSLPARLTTAVFHDEMPAAAVDGGGRLWLFWSADLGDRRNLYSQTLDAGVWSAPVPITSGPQRDEAPAAVWWNNRLWLFWQSNRNGRWQIWSQEFDGVQWSSPAQLTTHPDADQAPAPVMDAAGRLRLFWQSQQRADWYKSRTVDFNDADMLAQLQQLEDRAHYTYDTAVSNQDLYAQGAVGLYIYPDTPDPVVVSAQLNRVKGFVEAFRPLPVRFVWLAGDSVIDVVEEVIENAGLIGEEFDDIIV